jgi:DNA-binding NarL/FixJ family response regulator
VRVVVAEDSVLLRQGIVSALRDAGQDVVGEAGTADALLSIVESTQPDVAIVDIRMPPGQSDEGLRAAGEIRHRFGDGIGILILSQYAEPGLAVRALEIGRVGIGYLLKEHVRAIADLTDAVERVGRGGFVVDPDVVGRLVGRHRSDLGIESLSERERQVLASMAEGRSNAAIADRLGLALKTVEAYVASIFSKLGLEPAASDSRRVLAVLAYLREA